MTAASLSFDMTDHVMLVVHADMPPDDRDWARMVLVRNASRDNLRGILVVAPPRASINAAQRANVAQFMKETRMNLAVLTDSALIRGVALAVGLVGVKVRAFAPSELVGALESLGVPASRHADLTRRIESLKAQLSRTRSIPPA